MARGAAALDERGEGAAGRGLTGCRPDSASTCPDADSIAAGFESVAQRWGELNSLVHTIGPGDGYFEEMDRRRSGMTRSRWAPMSGCGRSVPRCRCLRAAGWAQIVTLSAAFDSATEPADRRLYRIEGGIEQRHQEPVAKALPRTAFWSNCVCPGTIVTASFTENLKDILAADGLDAHRSHRRDDRGSTTTFIQPCTTWGAPACPGDRVHHRLSRLASGATDMSPARRSASTAAVQISYSCYLRKYLTGHRVRRARHTADLLPGRGRGWNAPARGPASRYRPHRSRHRRRHRRQRARLRAGHEVFRVARTPSPTSARAAPSRVRRGGAGASGRDSSAQAGCDRGVQQRQQRGDGQPAGTR